MIRINSSVSGLSNFIGRRRGPSSLNNLGSLFWSLDLNNAASRLSALNPGVDSTAPPHARDRTAKRRANCALDRSEERGSPERNCRSDFKNGLWHSVLRALRVLFRG